MEEGKVGMKFSKFYALINFFEEKKFSVMRLKDCVPHGMEFRDDFDFQVWDQKKIVEILWDTHTYPAYILQFGGMYYYFIIKNL